MWEYVPVIIISVVIVFLLGLFLSLFLRKDKGGDKEKKKKVIKSKDRNKVLRESNKRLSQNPKDPEALQALAEMYFHEGLFDKAYNFYTALVSLCAMNPEINEFEATLKLGLSALKLGNNDEAYKSLLLARTFTDDHFELNYNLGFLEYTMKEYDKAVTLFKKALVLEPEHVQTIRFLGHSYFMNRQYSEAAEHLRKAIEFEPNDKESLFALAQCHFETGKTDRALSIFSHLRLDPVIGPKAALFAGTIHLNSHNQQKAIMDFEIGLKHKVIKPEIQLELKYRLAVAYVKQSDIKRALDLFEEIYAQKPDYKDVGKQISYFRELLTNKELQIFLISPNSEFLTLCRRIASNFFESGKTKLINISLNKSEYADILAEVHTKRFEDMVMFRFIRTTGVVGELIVRDFYTTCKENRADKGYCITAGEYTDSAKQFVEARLIDLIDKNDIVKLFKRISLSTQ
ncbi:MAG: tetratricopeptide repeat protein [Spirochaetaceae bacterium]|nr:MAG: tetratricopeptide repeat protein [Spirochaetaceae bacterium]